MDVIAEPIPGKTGGPFDNSEWHKEAAAGKMTPQEFVDSFKKGGEKTFQDIVSSNQMRILEGIKSIPDPNAQEAVLHTVIEFHKVKPTKFLSPKELEEMTTKAQDFISTEWQGKNVEFKKFDGNLAELTIKPQSAFARLRERMFGHKASAGSPEVKPSIVPPKI